MKSVNMKSVNSNISNLNEDGMNVYLGDLTNKLSEHDMFVVSQDVDIYIIIQYESIKEGSIKWEQNNAGRWVI